MANRRHQGFALIEVIMSVSVLGIVTAGAFVGWSLMSRHNRAGHLNAQAAQLARTEIERAKLNGPGGLPLGTYVAATGLATWNGAYDATANAGVGGWVSSLPVYYNVSGAQVASSSGASFVVSDTITDSIVLASGGSGYVLQPASQRQVVVTVSRASDGATVFTMGTILAQGGI